MSVFGVVRGRAGRTPTASVVRKSSQSHVAVGRGNAGVVGKEARRRILPWSWTGWGCGRAGAASWGLALARRVERHRSRLGQPPSSRTAGAALLVQRPVRPGMGKGTGPGMGTAAYQKHSEPRVGQIWERRTKAGPDILVCLHNGNECYKQASYQTV